MEQKIPYAFNPSIFFPAYLTRKRLLRYIQLYAPVLKGRLVDFGCGSKPYQSLFSVNEYIGIDYDNPGHSHVNEHIDLYYDGKKIPLESESIDSVFSSEVFEHIFNLEDILSELYRILKPGGQMLLTCPFSICEHEVPNDFARYSSFALQHLLTKHGFQIVQQHKAGNAVETIHQLFITYFNQYIIKYVAGIPVLRTIVRKTIFPLCNVSALVWGKILPRGNNLYLNNVVLCKKQL